jgi:acylaminoacyl-peptidase
MDVVVTMNQANLAANKKRTFLSTVYIPDGMTSRILDYRWSPFPFEISEVDLIVPSPSGAKLLLVRNAKNRTSAAKVEIWGPGQLLKEIFVAASVHGSIYSDGWYDQNPLIFPAHRNSSD